MSNKTLELAPPTARIQGMIVSILYGSENLAELKDQLKSLLSSLSPLSGIEGFIGANGQIQRVIDPDRYLRGARLLDNLRVNAGMLDAATDMESDQNSKLLGKICLDLEHLQGFYKGTF